MCLVLWASALVHSALYPRAKALLYTTVYVRSGYAHDSLRRYRFTAGSGKYFALTERLALYEKHDTTLSPHTLSMFLLSFAGVPFPSPTAVTSVIRIFELIAKFEAMEEEAAHPERQSQRERH